MVRAYRPPNSLEKGLTLLTGLVCGYLIGYVLMETADTVSGRGRNLWERAQG